MKIESIDVKDNNNYRAVVKSDEHFKIKILEMIVCVVLLVLSSVLIKSILNNGNLYNFLNKPRFAPKFKTAYILLNIFYLLNGLAYIIMLFKPKKEMKNRTKIMFLLSIIFTMLVPLVYFRFKFRLVGAILLALHVVLVSFIIADSYKVNKAAAIMQIPYMLFLLFMTYILMYAKVLA